MKFETERDVLLGPVAKAIRGTSGGAWSQRWATALLLTASGTGSVTVTGQDGDLSISVTLAASVHEPGSVLVPGRLLVNLIRSAPAGPVSVSLDSGALVLVAGRSFTRLHQLDKEDLPQPAAALPPEHAMSVSASALADGIASVAFAAASAPERSILTGVLCEARETGMRLVATDSYRLAVADLDSVAAFVPDGRSTLIPARTMQEVARLCDGTDTATVAIGDGSVVFGLGAAVVTSRLIEGAYPNYGQLIPSETVGNLTVDSSALLQSLGRVSLLAGDLTHPVRFGLNPDAPLSLCAESASNGGDVLIGVNDVVKPAVIRSPSAPGFTSLVMPVRM